jgi:hypothetical protein
VTDGPEEEPPFVVAIREHLGAEPSALSVVSQDFPLLAPRGGGLMAGPSMDLGPVQYVDVDLGPGGTLTCLQSGLMLARRESGPMVVLVATGAEFGPRAGKVGVEALAPAREDAERFLADAGCWARMNCGPTTAKEPRAGYILDASRSLHRP